MFASSFAALYAAHMLADHWVQTQSQATRKVLPGNPGRIACLQHIGTYTLTAGLALLLVGNRTGLTLHPMAVCAGLVFSAATHYIADRRVPLRRVADWLGKDSGWLDRGGGMYALDQAWHVTCLFASALIIA